MTDPLIDLGDYEEPFKGLVEQSIAGIFILQDGRFHYVNETFARMCGLKREKLIGADLRNVAPPDQAAEMVERYERRQRGEAPDERYIVRRTSRRRPGSFELHSTPVIYRGRPAMVGVGIDITEQERQKAELVAASQRLQELVANANSVREKERARVAQELHDVVGGMLTAVKFDASRLSMGLQQLQERSGVAAAGTASKAPALASLSATATQVIQLIQDTIEAVRTISEGLRPGVLDHLGLQDTLVQELQRFEQRYGIHCRFDTAGPVQPLDKDREIGIYRIFQEALTNVARHSKATQLRVSLIWSAQELALEVADNGLGLTGGPPPAGKRLGQLGMRERARELAGRLELGAGPQAGTSVQLRVPTRPSGHLAKGLP
ncbi:MAG TPA: PAS domain-containing sensor histidine kinase [Rubrivivax sp.]|nr:PAS domain-containing sensor histidine kinase [Rubrivivax sp.]